MAIFPRAMLVVRDWLGGDAIFSPIDVSNLVFPLDSSPRIKTISPAFADIVAPRQAHALFATWAVHKSETSSPLPGEDAVGNLTWALEALTSPRVFANTERKGATCVFLRETSSALKSACFEKCAVNIKAKIIPENRSQSIGVPIVNVTKAWTNNGIDANDADNAMYASLCNMIEFLFFT
mmetsp:Transcript_15324/g.22315  ORF Transcript_15324/g.22315 Transcript_15324/m.22315 type:complete len:180 (-) Transcript_15324:658-1197(-)